MKYCLYIGTKQNGSIEELLIDAGELKEFPVSDYFLPSTTNIEKCGEFEIEGDTHM